MLIHTTGMGRGQNACTQKGIVLLLSGQSKNFVVLHSEVLLTYTAMYGTWISILILIHSLFDVPVSK